MQMQAEVHARAIARRIFDLCTDYGEVEQLAQALVRAGTTLKPDAVRAFLVEVGSELHVLHDDDAK